MSPLPPPLTPHPLPGGETPDSDGTPHSIHVHSQEDLRALLEHLQVKESAIPSLQRHRQPPSAASVKHIPEPCRISSDLVNGLLSNGQRAELIQLLLSKVAPALFPEGTQATYREAVPACIAKTRGAGEGKRSEGCGVPESLPSAAHPWPPVNKSGVQFSVHITALTMSHVKQFCFQ